MTSVWVKIKSGPYRYTEEEARSMVGQMVPQHLRGERAGQTTVVDAKVEQGELSVLLDLTDASPDVVRLVEGGGDWNISVVPAE